MFEQTFVQTQAQTRKPWTVAVSLTVQCMAIGVLLLLPLLHPETLRMPDPPQPHLIRTWITQPPIPPQNANSRATTMSVPTAPRPFIYTPPSAHPTSSAQVDVPTADPDMIAWSGTSSATFGPPLGIATGALPPRAEPKPTTPAVAVRPVASGPIRVGTGVESAKLVFGPHPVYPQVAKVTHSQGVVKLEAIIAVDGSIRNLRVVSGPPLLIDAASNAVRQWRYSPTLLNGVAVEVITEIDVNFTLN